MIAISYHGQSHAVNLVLILCLVLSEGTVTLEQLVEHAAKREPVCTRVVRCAFAQNFGRHIAMCASAK